MCGYEFFDNLRNCCHETHWIAVFDCRLANGFLASTLQRHHFYFTAILFLAEQNFIDVRTFGVKPLVVALTIVDFDTTQATFKSCELIDGLSATLGHLLEWIRLIQSFGNELAECWHSTI